MALVIINRTRFSKRISLNSNWYFESISMRQNASVAILFSPRRNGSWKGKLMQILARKWEFFPFHIYKDKSIPKWIILPKLDVARVRHFLSICNQELSGTSVPRSSHALFFRFGVFWLNGALSCDAKVFSANHLMSCRCFFSIHVARSNPAACPTNFFSPQCGWTKGNAGIFQPDLQA